MQQARAGKKHTDPKNAHFTLALVGSGRTWSLLAGILDREEFAEAFPWVKLVGRVAGKKERSAPLPPCMVNVPVYPDCAALFAANPQVSLACDLSGDGSGMEELRRAAPAGTALVTEETVYLFCQATAAGALVIGGGARLRRARDIFTTIIDQIEEDVLVIDQSGHIMDVNLHVVERLGGTKADYIGLSCKDLEKLDICFDNATSAFTQTLLSGKRMAQMFSKVTEDGRMRHFRIYAFPIVAEIGHTRRVVLMRSDTTAHVQIEQRLQQSEKMAAIGELSTYIAHEIRNPLFAIGGFANSLLRSSSLDEAAREKAHIILEESKRLDEILKSILNFARPTDQAVGEIDTNIVASQTVELMGIGGDERHITINLELTEDLPKVRGNAEMLKQCLINLVKNAQEAMPQGGTIQVRTKLAGANVLLQVQDTGMGIPPELQERVFSPFFSTKDKGAGLGLAMTRKIIEEMGGRVHLSSQPEKGTIISLTLRPVLAVPAASPDQDEEKKD